MKISNLSYDNYGTMDMATLVKTFSPLVINNAYFYRGRGAEVEDLMQEGYLALMLLIGKCEDMRWLPKFLKDRLPGYVRAAAERMRSKSFYDAECLEDNEEFICESETPHRRGEYELKDAIMRVLTVDEADLVQARLEGFTQKELAELLNISQQAVSLRMKNIRDKLRPLLKTFSE